MAPFNQKSLSSLESNSTRGDSHGSCEDQIFVVSCYSEFSKLAHGPRGQEASQTLYVYRFKSSDGSMVLLNVTGDPKKVINPAFSRFHPRLNVLYACTEDIEKNGQIFAFSIDSDGGLQEIGHVDAGGTSTCYLTIDRDEKNLLAVNYWDSTLVTIPLSTETGEFIGGVKSKYDPKYGKGIVAATKSSGGVNHSNNDDLTIKQRQADPHSHALVLDPYFGCIAYVPCLGKDLIREFYYNVVDGSIEIEMNNLPSGLCTGHPDGPRYLCFHPRLPIVYVVNELSSTVAVFSVNTELIKEINATSKTKEDLEKFKGKSTLSLLQSISTIPLAFPKKLNTCGRICIHDSGRFVIVSNRGHQSIVILKVNQRDGMLSTVGYFHTRGETPRHFKFDNSGQYLLVANQDSDNISIFNFNTSTGEIKFTGNEYRTPSPNFICCCSLHDQDSVWEKENNDYSSQQGVHSFFLTSESDDLKHELAKAKDEIHRLKEEISLLKLKN